MDLSLVQLLSFQACTRGFWAFTPSLPSSPLLSCGAAFLLEQPPDVVVLTGLAMSTGLCLSVFMRTRQAPPLAARRA